MKQRCVFKEVYLYLDIICKIPHTVPISAHHKWNYDSLLEKMWDYLKLVRIYTKPKGQVRNLQWSAFISIQ